MRAALAALLSCLTACAGPQGTRVTPDEMARREAAARPPLATRAADAPPVAQPSLAARELGTRRLQLNAALDELRQRREDVEARHDLEQRGEALAQRHAEQRLARAQRERTLHDEVVVPLRLREAELEIAELTARQRAAQEELEAMEQLWAEADETDSVTAAELLTRAREQLARASQALELARLRRRDLVERVLPAALEACERELAEAGLALEQASLAQRVGATRRAGELAGLAEERRALDQALAAVESESARLGREGGLLYGGGG